jgi:integrase
LASRTRRDYQRVFDYLRPIGDTALLAIDRPLIVRIRDKAADQKGRRFGNYVKQVLSLLFAWASERGLVKENIATGIKNIRRSRDAPRANRPWRDDERFAVIDAAPWHLKVPLALGMYAGFREGDALAIEKSAFDGRTLIWRTRKTRQLVTWPVGAALLNILNRAPSHEAPTLAANSRGETWTSDGFRASWRKLRVELENSGAISKGLTFHGLRHTVASILAEEGFDSRTIADALGQATEEMARHYSRDADRARKMRAVVTRLNKAERRRRQKPHS